MSTTTYKRIFGRDVWHFHPFCQHSRSLASGRSRLGRTSTKKPTTGELCNECQSKARAEGRLGRPR